MMRKAFFILPLVVSCIQFGCNEIETEGVSSIKYYPEITIEGDPEVFLNVGDRYEDAGARATSNEVEIEVNVSALGVFTRKDSVDTSVPDIYEVSYAAKNEEGFSGSSTRQVIVRNNSDLVTGIEGLYTADVSFSEEFTGLKYVIISALTDSTYSISDAFAGYYHYGFSTGLVGVAAGLEIKTIDLSGNEFEFNAAPYAGLFEATVEIQEMEILPETKQIKMKSRAFSPAFDISYDIVLNQVP